MARCLSHFFDTLQPNSVLKNGDWLRRPSEFFLIQEYGKVPVPLFQHAATKIPRERNWPILLAVWASFLLFGAIAAPVPGVNEPHYLSKSRHYWQPKWCERDFFLASPNAHSVFYATIGGLTQFGSFDQAAWAGRAISNFVLAWGWTQAFSLLFFTRWGPLWTAWLYLALAACGNFSGEWLVGGVEGKVLCYGFLLAALGEVLQHRPILAAMWAGLAVSFHPVVGLWGVLAFVLSQGIQHVWETKRLRRRQARDAARAQRIRTEHADRPVTGGWDGAGHRIVAARLQPVASGILTRDEAQPLGDPQRGLAIAGEEGAGVGVCVAGS